MVPENMISPSTTGNSSCAVRVTAFCLCIKLPNPYPANAYPKVYAILRTLLAPRNR
jgi:hypothetical protein